MTLSPLSGNGIKELDGFGKPGKNSKPYTKLQKRNTHVKRLEEDERQCDFLQNMFQKGIHTLSIECFSQLAFKIQAAL